MERSEQVGLGVALVGHAVLFGLLSVGFLSTPNPLKLKQQPIDVSLVDAVSVEAEAPVIQLEAPAQSKAPEEGPAEQAAPPEAAPEPVPAPEPEPAPPAPAPPRPSPPKPAPPKPAPRPAPKPAPAPKPVPQPVRKPRPQPAAAEPTRARPTPARPAPAAQPKAAARPAAQPKAAAVTAARGTGSSATGTARRPTGRLDNLFQAGVGVDPSPSKAETPRAARIGAQATANIASAIIRQVQPCANRQVTPGPGAERIRVDLNLRINRDGSLAARPVVRGHQGVDDGNQRYVARVDDLAIATFVGCAPLKGLPPELYDVPGGWSNFTLRYKLPG